MSLAQIKQELSALTGPELDEVTAYLFHIRHRADPEYAQVMEDRLNEPRQGNWLSLEQFEELLENR